MGTLQLNANNPNVITTRLLQIRMVIATKIQRLDILSCQMKRGQDNLPYFNTGLLCRNRLFSQASMPKIARYDKINPHFLPRSRKAKHNLYLRGIARFRMGFILKRKPRCRLAYTGNVAVQAILS
jgi:hypothetical protein